LLEQDVDFFKFTAPAGPRDYMRLRITNTSRVAVHVQVFNPDKAPIGNADGEESADVTYEFPVVPGGTHFIEVRPRFAQGGAYSLVVSPTRSFDAFEENDSILTAKEIGVGRAIDANVMDTKDTDFYKFQARGATTVVALENASDSLAAALSVTDSDKAPVGQASGEEAANVRYSFESKPGSTYHVQVSARYSRGGKYSLVVQ
jgi:hypothetical protein